LRPSALVASHTYVDTTGAKPRKFVAVAGNIGVGKSTLVDFLATQHGFRPFVEPNLQNPYLDDFYSDMSAWAFHSQISFLAHKFRIHMDLMAEPLTVVQDRTIYEDAEIFARHLHQRGLMSDRDWGTYSALYSAMTKALAPPDLLIVLRCSVKAIRRRIRQRGRANEQMIPTAYLKQLNGLYEGWFEGWDRCPVVEIDTEKLDYIQDFVHRQQVERAMKPFLS
jgi:deoxyadenosine/deoxycytidine kinase